MRHSKISVLLVVLVVCLVAACQQPPAHTARALAAADVASMIPISEAITIASGQVPDGVPVGAALEVEDDDEQEPPAWEVSFFVAGANQIIAVEVHAHSGAVLEVEVEDDERDDDSAERGLR